MESAVFDASMVRNTTSLSMYDSVEKAQSDLRRLNIRYIISA
jgi:hypothetical protein